MSQPPPPERSRLWLFRVAAATLVPALVLVALEGALRLFGVGYDAAFLVGAAGRDSVWTTNPRYGWRFFPRRLARAPVPFELEGDKGDAYRVFVIGGSAARGTPDPAYGFGRALEALLEAAHPGVRFEVANAAMTAVNSHVALDIARACARRDADLLVVYLGNNEVVGPFGAGTVFGDFSPSLTAIRAAITIKSTRTGQLMAAVATGRREARLTEWRGMEMFLEQRVAADDPRLSRVYEHFHRNLSDLVASAERRGAATVLVTVATNLADQPPFASLHRADLSAADLERWQAAVAAGARAEAAGTPVAAITQWQRAATIDDRHAELQFRIGRALLELGRLDEARRRFVLARDLDALRFRADSKINDTIRRVASERAANRATLVDAAAVFAAGGGDPAPLPGHRLFYEHVHLTFEGNVALARLVAEHLEPRLPDRIRRRRVDGPASRLSNRQVAERLAFTPFDRRELLSEILRMVSRPPFTGQLGHEADLEARRQELANLETRLDAEAWRRTESLYRRRLEEDGSDLELRRRFATLLAARGRHAEAAREWRFLVDRLGEVGPWRAALARALADAGSGEEALAELERLRRLDGDSAALSIDRGTVFEAMERFAAAEEQYARALELDPNSVEAAFNQATVALRAGDFERAEELYRRLLARRPDFAPAHHNLGLCLERRGRPDEAVDAYRRAIEADPGLAPARNSLALALARRGDVAGALEQFRRAVTTAPGFALAHFNLADLMLERGDATGAAKHYRRGLALAPGNDQARANLALALRILAEAGHF